MIETSFYHNTIRSYTISFGSLFNGIRIERENSNGDVIDTIPVPLIYSDKEKFIIRANSLSSIENEVRIQETLPRMGFELTSMTSAPNRKTNTMNRIVNSGKDKFMFNRVPYDFNYSLYVATRKVDDALRIVEQIVPYFTPELGIRINTMKDFPDMIDDIPINLDGVSADIDGQGNFDDRRVSLWELNFTLKGWLYCNVRNKNSIKKTIIDISDSELNTFYEGYLSQIDPLYSSATDEHGVDEQILSEGYNDGVASSSSGASIDTELS